MNKFWAEKSEAGVQRLRTLVAEPMPGLLKSTLNAQRLAARQAHSLVEKEQLIKHLQISLDLVLMDEQDRHHALMAAKAEVERWRSQALCSEDFIEAWEELLSLPVAELVKAMTSLEREAVALRQNSPWIILA